MSADKETLKMFNIFSLLIKYSNFLISSMLKIKIDENSQRKSHTQMPVL